MVRDRLGEDAELLLALPQAFLGPLALGDIAEQHRHLAAARRLDPGGGDLDMAAHGDEGQLEADRHAAAQHPAVEVEPPLLLAGGDLAQPLADDVRDARMPLVAGIGLHMDVVAHRAVGTVDELDDAEPVIHRLEQGAVALFALGQGHPDGALRVPPGRCAGRAGLGPEPGRFLFEGGGAIEQDLWLGPVHGIVLQDCQPRCSLKALPNTGRPKRDKHGKVMAGNLSGLVEPAISPDGGAISLSG